MEQNSRKKIAVLTVYVDQNDTNSSVNRTGMGEWEMVLGGEPNQSMDSVRTAAAHEMGHFISHITREPSHNPRYHLAAELLDDNRLLLPSEQYAWKLAHEMVPPQQFDYKMEEESVGTYAGTHNFDPVTGTIAKLENPVKENPFVNMLIQSIATKEDKSSEANQNSSKAQQPESSCKAEPCPQFSERV